MKIVESGEMQVVDEQITAEYVKALAKTGRMTQSNTNKVVDFLKRFETGSSSKQTGGTFSRHYSRGGGSRYQQSGAGSLGASQESPLIVQFAEKIFQGEDEKGHCPTYFHACQSAA